MSSSPLTAAFIRTFHHLPPSDRRPLLRELGVTHVPHQNDGAFYEWLAERYRNGEAPKVDAALRRCCVKAEERTSVQRVVTWLAKQAGRKAPPSADDGERLAWLVQRARDHSPETAAIVDALAPNFAWFGSDVPMAETSPPLNAETVAARLAAALDRLAAAPDLDLLLRADALAAAIEQHLDAADGRAEREDALRRVAAAWASLSPEEREQLGDEPPAVENLTVLHRIADDAEQLPVLRTAVADAQEALRRAVSSRQERTSAIEVLDAAEEAYEAACARVEAALTDVRDHAALEQATAPPIGEVSSAEPETEPAGSAADEATAEAADPVPMTFDPSADAPIGHAEPVPDRTVEPEEHPADVPSLGADDDQPQDETMSMPDIDEAPVTPIIDPPADPPVSTHWNRWVSMALAGDRAGLAFHLATARDLAGGDAGGLATPVVEALVHGRAVRAAYDAAWHRYEALREPLVGMAAASSGPGVGQARTLLLAAGALRPALVQSQTAIDVLDGLSGELAASLNPLIRLLGDMRGAGVTSLDDIAAPAGADDRRLRARASREALERWRYEAPERTTNYPPATLIWRAMVAPDGPIGRVVATALRGAPEAGADVRTLLDQLDDRDAIERLIENVDVGRSGRRHSAIEGMALKSLLNLSGAAADLLRDWLRSQGAPGEGGDRHRARRGALARALAAAEAVAIAAAPSGGDLVIAAGVFATMARGLAAELDGGQGAPPQWSPDDELALLSDFPLNGRRDVLIGIDDAADLERAAEQALRDGVPDAETAFAAALLAGNATAAGRLLGFLPVARRETAISELDAMIARGRMAARQRGRALRQKLDDLQISLDGDDQLPDEIEGEMSSFEQAAIDKLPSTMRGAAISPTSPPSIDGSIGSRSG